MTNNDILRRLRYALQVNDSEVMGIFAHINSDVKQSQVVGWLKGEGEDGFVALSDPESVSYTHLTLPTTPYV